MLIWIALWRMDHLMTMLSLFYLMMIQILEMQLYVDSYLLRSILFELVQVKLYAAISHQMENCLQVAAMIKRLYCGIRTLQRQNAHLKNTPH
ncbi:hypothetical protein NMG60_11000887 [Bertholletia excelsa]